MIAVITPALDPVGGTSNALMSQPDQSSRASVAKWRTNCGAELLAIAAKPAREV
ncbi:MAG: hypothetical protein U1F11_07080 [Steroidobacteraceae bacterium]